MPSPHIKQTTNVLSAASGLSGAASVSGGALATSVGAISSNPFSLNAGSGRSLDLSINTVPGKEFIVFLFSKKHRTSKIGDFWSLGCRNACEKN
jgi:hypothetical protein